VVRRGAWCDRSYPDFDFRHQTLERQEMNFDQAFSIVVGEEGGLSLDPSDRGNWTGGAVNAGQLKGTKYGVSAMVYPDEDIANLTLDRAQFLFKRDYWDKISGDYIPALAALGLFDAAINEGVSGSVHLGQKALGLTSDGVVGPQTIARLNAVDTRIFARSFAIARINAYASQSGWAENHNGWVGRVLDLYRQMVM
jgi:lysozyme family protein